MNSLNLDSVVPHTPASSLRPRPAVAEKYLYPTVAVGSNLHNLSPVIKGETRDARYFRIRNLQMTQTKRNGHQIAEDLLVTLAMNTRLASLVKTLWLGLEPVDDPAQSEPDLVRIYREWTQTNISILQICPNVNQAEIRGFAANKRDTLLSVLKEKIALIVPHIYQESVISQQF